MNETPDPHRPDDELADALGDALRDAPDDLVIPPPVTDIAERAAAKARARTTRRAVGSIAASVMLVAGGVVVWNSANDGEPDQLEVAVESVDDPAAESALDEAAADDPAAVTSGLVERGGSGVVDVDPAEYSTAAPLAWAEIPAPPDGGGGSLMTLPDGRVMVRLWSEADGVDRVLVTSDGQSWEPVAMPAGVSPSLVDLGDELWVVTGWDRNTAGEFGDGVYVSSDEGASWQQLEVPGLDETADSYLVTRGYIGAAAAFGDQAVVAVSSFTELDVAQIAMDQGIVTSPDEVVGSGWSASGDQITEITIDVGTRFGTGGGEPEPVDVETFTFTPDEIGLPSDTASLYGSPDGDGFTIFVGDAAGLAPVADLAGNPSRLLVVGDELLLSGFTQTGATVWTSGDGITWTATDVGDGFEMAGRFQGDLWGGGWSPEGFVVERFDSAGVETVATFPGLNLNSLLSAGPSGLAATVTVEVGPFEEEAFPVEPFDEEEFPVDEGAILEPGVMASQNGIDLRVEEDGTGTLIDTNTGEILREFTEAEMNADDAPAGVVETDDGTTFSLRIEDPETGEELVTFSIEDYTQGFDAPVTESSGSGFSVDPGAAVAEGDFFEAGPGTSFDEGEFIAPENWIAWSSNGTDWNFQRSAEAFGLNDGQDAWTQIAVGDGYVIAMLESFTEPAVTSEGDGDFFPTIRWFRAETG